MGSAHRENASRPARGARVTGTDTARQAVILVAGRPRPSRASCERRGGGKRRARCERGAGVGISLAWSSWLGWSGWSGSLMRGGRRWCFTRWMAELESSCILGPVCCFGETDGRHGACEGGFHQSGAKPLRRKVDTHVLEAHGSIGGYVGDLCGCERGSRAIARVLRRVGRTLRYCRMQPSGGPTSVPGLLCAGRRHASSPFQGCPHASRSQGNAARL